MPVRVTQFFFFNVMADVLIIYLGLSWHTGLKLDDDATTFTLSSKAGCLGQRVLYFNSGQRHLTNRCPQLDGGQDSWRCCL